MVQLGALSPLQVLPTAQPSGLSLGSMSAQMSAPVLISLAARLQIPVPLTTRDSAPQTQLLKPKSAHKTVMPSGRLGPDLQPCAWYLVNFVHNRLVP